MSGEGPGRVRGAAGLLVILVIMAAFVFQLSTGDRVQPWLVLLVSVLGLAAGAAVLGADAVMTGYAVLRGLRGGKR